MVKHPKDRLARRDVYAKSLESPLFRQRVRHATKRQLKEEINLEEAEDELFHYRHGDFDIEPDSSGRTRLDPESDTQHTG